MGVNRRSPALAQVLRQGFAAQQSGHWALAESLYREVLSAAPEDPDAWQLLGSAARRRGDAAEAERCFRRSLAAHEAQPHVWNNLANLLWALGRRDEAEPCLHRALALHPDYADAHYNLARMQHARADPRAQASLSRAWSCVSEPTAGMLQLQAAIWSDAGRLGDALGLLEQALLAAPTRSALHHNRAVLLHRLGRHDESRQAHQQALALGQDDADAHYNFGNTLQALGEFEDAVQAYGRAIARDATHALALFDLARLRWRLGHAEPDRELRKAHESQALSATPAALAAHLRWRAGDYLEAARWFREAHARAPDDAAHLDGLARSLVRSGDLQEGLRLHRQAIEQAPGAAQFHLHLAASLLMAGDAPAALPHAERATQLTPTDQGAWALLGLCWRVLGDARETWLVDEARFVQSVELAAPADTSRDTYFDELATAIGALHQDHRAPVDQTLRHGTQTLGRLFEQPLPVLQALGPALAGAIDTYIEHLPSDLGHPFLSRRGRAWRFTGSWSSRLGDQGHHIDHVHPEGWISGVLYLRVPAACRANDSREGWLRFGQPDLDLSRLGLSHLARRHVEPRVGRLVLFPSMMWHGTVPFTSSEARLTIAFDLVPT